MGDWSFLDIAMFSLWILFSLIIVGNILRNARKLSAADMVICVGAIAAIVATFLPWYGWELIHLSLWDISRGAAYVISGAAVVALAEISSRVMFYGEGEGLIGRGAMLEGVAMLLASGLVTLFTIIRMISVPDIKEGFGMYIIIGRSWGLSVGLIAAMIFVTGSVMKFLEKR